jgi:signal transduction histidine kinase
MQGVQAVREHTAGVELGPEKDGGGAFEVDASRSVAPKSAARKTVEGGSRWRLRNWRLRTKLVAVITVPIITAFALGALRAENGLSKAADYDKAASNVSATLDVVALVHELQNERNLVVAFVAGNRVGDVGTIQSQFQRTDAGLNRLQQAVTTVNEDDPDAYLLERLAGRLAAVGAIRDAAMRSQYPEVGVFGTYSSLLEAVLSTGAEFTASLGDPEINSLANSALSIVEGKEFLGRQNAILMIAATKDSFPAGMLEQALGADAAYVAAISNFRANAAPEESQYYSDTYSGAEIDHRESLKELAFNRAAHGVSLQIPMDALLADARATADALRKVENSLLEKLRSKASAAADVAKQGAWRDAAIIIAAIILALIITLIVSRSLLVPLRVLRRDALDVANRRLPETVQRILADPDPVEAAKNAVEPVPVFTREETGQLARSFDAVHDQAVRMATEQALLRDNINSIFVNLSRRSQTLVERQLSLIDRLEQDEQDPDQLASLFELDHLATRMRRNSESLLVLSGSGLSRQLSRPVPAAEVVGAAVSEVEQYARIEVLSAPDIAVQGRAVSDLVHLIAELLDNATFFSEPEKKVYVRMAVTRKKELAIQITDSGVGMSDDEIEMANTRLADPPDLDVAVTRRMGLYVVARLAKRHEIIVRLRDNEDIEGGLIARITVPAALVYGSGAPAQTNNIFGPMTTPPPSVDDTAAKASGIAGAFTGGMPRLRADGGIVGESQVELSAAEVTSFPAFEPQFGAQGADDTGGWGPPASPDEINATLNGHAYDVGGAFGLFGAPLPETPYDESSYQPYDPYEPYAETNYQGSSYDELNGSSLYEPSARPDSAGLDAPTERLPIYEAVLSQWFEAGDSGSAPLANGFVNGASVDHDAEHSADNGADLDVDQAVDQHEVDGEDQAEAVVEPEPAPVVDPWISPGDDGWERARALLDHPADTMTTAGLPKRVPKARLLPGSAAPREATTGQQPAVLPLPPRTADAIRGRMSSFQQGVRRGRHALVDAYPGDQTGSDESRQDEEQE